MKSIRNQLPDHIKHLSDEDFCKELDDFGIGHVYIHEAKKRIRRLINKPLNQVNSPDTKCNGNCHFMDDGRIEADPDCPKHGCR